VLINGINGGSVAEKTFIRQAFGLSSFFALSISANVSMEPQPIRGVI
jgi:hypothetical protein